MIQIRHNVFETNSSSTHSITMCSRNEYNEFKENKRFMLNENIVSIDHLLTLDIDEKCKSILTSLKEFNSQLSEEDDKYLRKNYIDSYNSYQLISNTFEEFFDKYIAANGEEIMAFGYYGYDS